MPNSFNNFNGEFQCWHFWRLAMFMLFDIRLLYFWVWVLCYGFCIDFCLNAWNRNGKHGKHTCFFFKWLCCPVSCFQQMTLIETHFVEAFWYFLQLDIRFRHLLKWLLRFLRLHQKLAKIPITLMNKITQNRWFQNLNKT